MWAPKDLGSPTSWTFLAATCVASLDQSLHPTISSPQLVSKFFSIFRGSPLQLRFSSHCSMLRLYLQELVTTAWPPRHVVEIWGGGDASMTL
jgi:hypothetical protein